MLTSRSLRQSVMTTISSKFTRIANDPDYSYLFARVNIDLSALSSCLITCYGKYCPNGQNSSLRIVIQALISWHSGPQPQISMEKHPFCFPADQEEPTQDKTCGTRIKPAVLTLTTTDRGVREGPTPLAANKKSERRLAAPCRWLHKRHWFR